MIHRLAALGLALALSLPATALAEETRVAVFDFELIDTSLEGEMRGANPDETRRIGMLGERLRGAIADAEGYELVDIAPVRATAKRRWLYRCNGCDATLAGKLGADWAVTGTVQKVSNLILNINVYVRDVETGELVQAMSADIRGNTDESWRRGLDWLLENRLDLGA